MKKAIILAAGKGTRMKSIHPKVVHQVCGKAMVNHVIDAARSAGVGETVVVLGHGIDEVRATVGEDVKIAVQAEQLGTGHAVMMADEYMGLDDTIMVLCGDTPLIEADTLEKFFAFHDEGGYAVSVLTTAVDDPRGYGRIIRDDQDRLLRIVEQKDANDQERAVKEINSGIYCFNGKYLKESLAKVDNNNAQGEYYLPDTIEKLIIIVNEILPFREWKCYLGRCGKNVSDVEDGILVWGRKDSQVLISVSYEYKRDKDTFKKIRTIVNKDDDWHEKIEAHPYLYFI